MSGFWSEKQRKDLEFFKRELPSLLQSPLTKGKFVLIHNESVKGAYDTFEAALKEAASLYTQDEFIIQQVLADSDTVSFLFSALRDERFTVA